jgi:uncharacterized protein YutE (UPF0331/DUF86 family)
MTARAHLHETSIKSRLIDTRGHVDVLQHACSKFGSDFGLDEFANAWKSADTEQRLPAYAVQAGYENAINGAIKIAQELCELEGWTPAKQEPSSIEALKRLQEHGLISAATRDRLRGAYESRSDLQDDYANVAVRRIHESTRATLEAVPLLLQDVALHIGARGRR